MSNRADRRSAEKQTKQSIRRALKNRHCGPCHACCFTQAVKEINKPQAILCSHVDLAKGCGIYNTRPAGCRAWNCLWRLGFFTNKDRPDLCGLVFDVTMANESACIYPGGQAMVAREFIKGAFDSSYSVLERLASDKLIILVDSDMQRRKVIGPPDQLEYMEQMIAQLTPS